MNFTLGTGLSASIGGGHLDRHVSRVRDRTDILHNKNSGYEKVNKIK